MNLRSSTESAGGDWPDWPSSDLTLTKGSNAPLTIINHLIRLIGYLLLDYNFGWRDNYIES